MKSLIVCINYNSYDSLDNYLESLNEAWSKFNRDHCLTVLVVDNSTNVKEIGNKYKYEFVHIVTRKNLGYFGGFSYGLEYSKEDLKCFDYIIVSNVDVTVSNDFFKKLYSIKYEDEIGCIAPAIYSLNEKKDRNPKILERTGTKKLKILRLMYKYPVLNYIYEILLYPIRRKTVKKNQQKYIYAAHGSFMIFKNKFFDFLKEMKYPVFLFGEEIYIAEQLRQRQLKTVYSPDIVIYDMDHVSTGKMKRKEYFKYNYEAIDMLLKEFFYE